MAATARSPKRYRVRWKRVYATFGVLLAGIELYGLVQLGRGYAVSFWEFPHFSVPPNATTVERSGLRLSVTDVERRGNEVRVSYAAEWVRPRPGERQLRFMRAWFYPQVVYRDARGDELEGATYRGLPVLDPQFTGREFGAYLLEGEVVVSPPVDAKTLSLRVAGLVTREVAIPEEPGR